MRIAVGLGRERGEKELEASGVSRRDFMKFCTAVAVTMGFGPAFATDRRSDRKTSLCRISA